MEACTVLFPHNSPDQNYIEIDIYLILKGIWILRVGHHGHVFKNILPRKLWKLNFPWRSWLLLGKEIPLGVSKTSLL